MIQTGNEQGYQGLQPWEPVGLSGNQRADQGGPDVEWDRRRGFMGH